MENKENNKSLFRRYLDDLYTKEDARNLMNELQTSEYNTEIFQELADDVLSLIHI